MNDAEASPGPHDESLGRVSATGEDEGHEENSSQEAEEMITSTILDNSLF